MTKQILKPVLIGILMGGAAYILPFFFFRGLLFFLVIGLIFRFFFWGRRGGAWGWYRRGGIHPAFADTIRNMSAEEYDAFKRKFDRDRMYDDDTKNRDVKP